VKRANVLLFSGLIGFAVFYLIASGCAQFDFGGIKKKVEGKLELCPGEVIKTVHLDFITKKKQAEFEHFLGDQLVRNGYQLIENAEQADLEIKLEYSPIVRKKRTLLIILFVPSLDSYEVRGFNVKSTFTTKKCSRKKIYQAEGNFEINSALLSDLEKLGVKKGAPRILPVERIEKRQSGPVWPPDQPSGWRASGPGLPPADKKPAGVKIEYWMPPGNDSNNNNNKVVYSDYLISGTGDEYCAKLGLVCTNLVSCQLEMGGCNASEYCGDARSPWCPCTARCAPSKDYKDDQGQCGACRWVDIECSHYGGVWTGPQVSCDQQHEGMIVMKKNQNDCGPQSLESYTRERWDTCFTPRAQCVCK
jgi:hypothetical protein